MSASAVQLSRTQLYYADNYSLVASGVFQFSDATYSVTFESESGLMRCLDMTLSYPDKPATPRLHLRPQGYDGDKPEWPLSNLRFDYDIDHHVAAAALLVLDKDANTHAWMTHGDVGRTDFRLVHDSWNPDERVFPPDTYISIAELRLLTVQWAFGDVLPPPAVRWKPVPHEQVGWF